MQATRGHWGWASAHAEISSMDCFRRAMTASPSLDLERSGDAADIVPNVD
jgi:hypothetical protein